MIIEAVDLFYLSMPVVTTEADGSQDALLVRVAGSGHVGWGECEASPLTSIAAFVTPMSHGVCRPVGEAVLGQTLDEPGCIARMSREVAYNSMDLLQAAHTWSGVEMALWDLLGQARGTPVWRLLGYDRSHGKTPYASQLFGATPHDTLVAARAARGQGFRAVKFGWGPIGQDVRTDAEHFHAAREGLGADGVLLVDVGQVWGEDVERAAARLPALAAAGARWLEEPFHASALDAYAALAGRSSVKLAGGEAAHNPYLAEHLIRYGRVGFVQIDCGRIGGIGPAKRVADYAVAHGVTYVNHTFTSHLALSASLQPYAGLADHEICEFPFAPKALARAIAAPIARDAEGRVHAPDAPGLGVEVMTAALTPYLVDTEIRVAGRTIYRTPALR